MILLNQAAPDFTLASTDGTNFSLRDAQNKSASQVIVLYFYPKDNTPGCTTEGLDFAAAYDDFHAANALILGISRDSLSSHQKFKEKLNLPFELLADPDETVCERYGVMKIKNMYGKQVRGIERSTFVITPQGIVAEWRGLRVPNHVTTVLNFVQTMVKSTSA